MATHYAGGDAGIDLAERRVRPSLTPRPRSFLVRHLPRSMRAATRHTTFTERTLSSPTNHRTVQPNCELPALQQAPDQRIHAGWALTRDGTQPNQAGSRAPTNSQVSQRPRSITRQQCCIQRLPRPNAMLSRKLRRRGLGYQAIQLERSLSA